MKNDPHQDVLAALCTMVNNSSVTVEELAAFMLGHAPAEPTVAEYINTTVIPALLPAQRKAWEPYLQGRVPDVGATALV